MLKVAVTTDEPRLGLAGSHQKTLWDVRCVFRVLCTIPSGSSVHAPVRELGRDEIVVCSRVHAYELLGEAQVDEMGTSLFSRLVNGRNRGRPYCTQRSRAPTGRSLSDLHVLICSPLCRCGHALVSVCILLLTYSARVQLATGPLVRLKRIGVVRRARSTARCAALPILLVLLAFSLVRL